MCSCRFHDRAPAPKSVWILFVALANVKRACDRQKLLVLSRRPSTELSEEKWRKKKKKGKQSLGLLAPPPPPSGYPSKGTLTVNSDLDYHWRQDALASVVYKSSILCPYGEWTGRKTYLTIRDCPTNFDGGWRQRFLFQCLSLRRTAGFVSLYALQLSQ